MSAHSTNSFCIVTEIIYTALHVLILFIRIKLGVYILWYVNDLSIFYTILGHVYDEVQTPSGIPIGQEKHVIINKVTLQSSVL